MVVGNLAGDVVSNVRLRNTMSSGCTDPAGDLANEAGAAKEVPLCNHFSKGYMRKNIVSSVPVKGGECATRESERTGTIVGEKRVGVLEEGDENKPATGPHM